MGSRRKARERAFEGLYKIEQAGESPERVLTEIRRSGQGSPAAGFAEELVKNVMQNIGEIDGKISSCSKNWRLSRIIPTDRNILRLAASELMANKTPPAVVLNEAVEIAKKYGTEKSGAFVNGILDCILKKISASNRENTLKKQG